MEKYQGIPLGFTLRKTIPAHSKEVNRIRWSQDGRFLASVSQDGTGKIWIIPDGTLFDQLEMDNCRFYSVDWSKHAVPMLAIGTSEHDLLIWRPGTASQPKRLYGHRGNIYCVAWSPHGRLLASGSRDAKVIIWKDNNNLERWSIDVELEGHEGQINVLAWSPTSDFLASGSDDGDLNLWDPGKKLLIHRIPTKDSQVTALAWSHDGKKIASGSSVSRIQIFDSATGKPFRVIDGHSSVITDLTFSADGQFLASKSMDGCVRLWCCNSWETVAVLPEESSSAWFAGLGFHPYSPILATLSNGGNGIRLWDLDFQVLAKQSAAVGSISYQNAKVVLLGETGAGKTGLSLVLTGQPWRATESTHGRTVLVIENDEPSKESLGAPIREVFLWDLAGQHDYRPIHQLHLQETSVALIVFDAAGTMPATVVVKYWNRAISSALGDIDSVGRLKKILVAAKAESGQGSIDRGIIDKCDLDGFVETSAKEGLGIGELKRLIYKSIPWSNLPITNSNTRLLEFKKFIYRQSRSLTLATVQNLARWYAQESGIAIGYAVTAEDLEIFVCLLQAEGIIRRLSFGNLVLLRPEVLDSYAAAILIAARRDVLGLGCVEEHLAVQGRLPLSKVEKLSDPVEEKILIIAAIEELLQNGIAFREQGQLVFPALLDDSIVLNQRLIRRQAAVIEFEGPASSIYPALVIRLSQSGFFEKLRLWSRGAQFKHLSGQECALEVDEGKDGSGSIVISFGELVESAARELFEDYVVGFLKRRTVPQAIQIRRVFECPVCCTPVSELQSQRRIAAGFDWIYCNVCEPPKKIHIKDEVEREIRERDRMQMEEYASRARMRACARSVVKGKEITCDFDVFFCFNSDDREEIDEIKARLETIGILPWLDREQIKPGTIWQRSIEEIISAIKAAAVFVGNGAMRSWQELEQGALMEEAIKREIVVIPVILNSCVSESPLPIFLKNYQAVDFRLSGVDPVEQLAWGITGDRNWCRNFQRKRTYINEELFF